MQKTRGRIQPIDQFKAYTTGFPVTNMKVNVIMQPKIRVPVISTSHSSCQQVQGGRTASCGSALSLYVQRPLRTAGGVRPLKAFSVGGGSGSPVNLALDGALLHDGGAREGLVVHDAAHARHGGLPCVVDVARRELDLDDLPALESNR